ncbi:hypothetical protein NSK_005458 [Nannochloropsis salina CCMP1776]|uniref:ABC-2 type transporter domain-containing protein n=1 Tax=Nannochloropsis salina CCMP1776 TaxID=1027361 RepID=A0A4D9CVI0_9STRA|nr:hypothetical protein NSK_005458 [Nannochloropsis salina CCMP1776]|eukprot:TFJ83242.1 hypothetical protein NSK_005458 [Nannochloropsis salina CCMP1776]
MSGILTATILMLHLLLLTAIFVNFDTMRLAWLGALRYLSFFQYGYEALVANEMAGRALTELPVESGTAVLTQLGFRPDRVDLNLTVLFGYLGAALVVAYLVLARCVKEER